MNAITRQRCYQNGIMPRWWVVGDKIFFTEEAARAWWREVGVRHGLEIEEVESLRWTGDK